ncbi:MAG: HAMP domain-containing sensor histidine kinase [Leptolyngbyaceae bacterium]|nr:HAMP domain-containing sensor histidine kinase [Leptolyngbyaceae bacterium]
MVKSIVQRFTRRFSEGNVWAIAPSTQRRSLWQRLIGETRTRILLLYVAVMTGVTAVSIPLFQKLLVTDIEQRVRIDLRQELEDFKERYDLWQTSSPQTEPSLQQFIDEFLAREIPEDDNYHIFLLNGKYYAANPTSLIEPIQPGSELMNTWLTLSDETRDVIYHDDPNIGSILYKTTPIILNGQYEGMFIVTHVTQGEEEEALEAVIVFVKVAAAVVTVSFLLAWLVSRQLLNPVRQLATAARSISESDLSRRLEVQGSGELADLTHTFNAMMNRIQQAFDSQRDFIKDAGHELRTPITIIQGHLELMGDDPEERRATLALVMDELDRMNRLVNDLVLLAKSERNDFLHLEPIDIHTLTHDLFTKATALAPRCWRLGAVANGQFVGDRQRVTGAMMNLAQNAAQHTQETDRIEIGSRVVNQTVQFWVRDTGEGILPEDQSRIFDRFARSKHQHRRSDGSGLGLAIVKAIAEAHGGNITLTSRFGVGSTFTMMLPLGDRQHPPRSGSFRRYSVHDSNSHC